MKFIQRPVPADITQTLEEKGVHPVLARLYAARGVRHSQELDDGLTLLHPPEDMLGTREAAIMLADAMQNKKKICIVADYDCDGATACATAIRGLRALGSPLEWNHVDYLVPDRVNDGYGLTPAIAERVKAREADILVTVDNGIASVEGVAHARALGLQVLITDHHLPAVENGRIKLPKDCVIVNPNQPRCTFPSKCMAGVGVMFYVLMALRAELRKRGAFDAKSQPRIDKLLPLVALGTIADVVKLDHHNRRLVAQGLKRIRAGTLPVGLSALFQVASRAPQAANSFDLGYAIGPRLNAAGRLADMTLGIACLTTDDLTHAIGLAQQLDAINRERKNLESAMREQALQLAELQWHETDNPPPALCVFDPQFHEGVVGIVAGRLKDKWHRPTFVFAASQALGKQRELKGSGRSIPGFHLRDALDCIAKRHPGLLLRFGGHAAAAGCTITKEHLALFEQELQAIAATDLDSATLQQQLEVDGPLAPEHRNLQLVDALQQEVWGQGFPPPVFYELLEIVSQRVLAGKHLQLKIKHGTETFDGMWFGHHETLPSSVPLAYRIEADDWQGKRRLRFLVEGADC